MFPEKSHVFLRNIMELYLQNYINGKLVAPHSGRYIPNYAPATGAVFSHVPDSDAEDVNAAVAAAKKAFVTWSQVPAEKRGDYLLELARLIEIHLEELAQCEMQDSGKPLSLCRNMDIPRAASNFKFFGTAIQQFASESHFMESGAINYTLRRPIGVAACISPWNLPLYLFTWKIAPALAAGNTVVAKPSELTPYTAFKLSELCIKAGLPEGVLNIIHGTGPSAGHALISHEDVPVISFTGGTKTGEMISSVVAPKFKKISLELGGKNPAVIFADCDFDKTVEQVVRASFTNQGQICLCGSRILVEQSIYEKFREAYVARVKEIRVGNPENPDHFMGAVISSQHLDKIRYYVALAQEEGGKILCGGEVLHPAGVEGGYYHAPTVIEGLPWNCRTNQEEIFGPVTTLMPFADEDEAIMIANSTGYGLASTVWTTNLDRAHRVAEKLQTGIVWINCWLLRDLRTPFGGMKNSGVGREGGWEALRFFTEAKNVCIKYR